MDIDIKVDSLDFTTIRLIDENGLSETFNLKEELAVNESNFDREMIEQPSKYIYWTSVLERVRMYQEQAERQLEFLEGRLDKEAREELPKIDIKPTKDSVEGYMRRHPDYQAQRQQCDQYEYLVRRLNFIVKAFEQRKDMLQSFGRQKSDEKQYGHGAGRYQEKYPDYSQVPQGPQYYTGQGGG